LGRMGYAQFAKFNVLGALLWVISLTYLGFFFGNVPLIKQNTGLVVIGIIIASLIPLAVTFVRERIKARQAARSHRS
jgi:membrane-associated protein